MTSVLQLLDTKELAGLGPERRAGTLSAAEIDAQLGGQGRTDSARVIHALVLLWHDHLHESHRISQEIENADGSMAHAIMHRREPDYWNSKYWWRRAGKHPAFGPIGSRAAELLAQAGESGLAKRIVPNGRWDPDAFVDEVEKGIGRPGEEILKRLQKLEFEALLEFLASKL